MASVNRVILLGNLGQDPELRYTPSGAPVCNLNIATSDIFTDKDGNKQTTTEWHRVVVWNKQAENCAKFLAKGRSVYIEGKLQTRSWDDKATGQKRYSTDIVAQTVQFVGGGAARDQGYQQQSYGAPAQQGGGHSQSANSQSNSSYNSNYLPPMDDPFHNDSFGGPSTPNLDEIPF
jgi:single-strand DNA-binding protein